LGGAAFVLLILALPLFVGISALIGGIGQLIKGVTIVFDHIGREVAVDNGARHSFSDIGAVELAYKKMRKGALVLLQLRLADGKTIEIDQSEPDDLALIRPFGEYLAAYLGFELIEVDDSPT
jgi:hypothetical protein